jgi:hypothetical protein
MSSLRDSFKFEVSSVKQERRGARDCGLRIADSKRPAWMASAQNEANLGSKRAKRTQFLPAAGGGRRELCETKPNLGGLGYVGKGSRRVGRGSAGE